MKTLFLSVLVLASLAVALPASAQLKKSDISTVTNAAGVDRVELLVLDANAPTGFKRRTIQVQHLLNGASGGGVTNVTTNLVTSNSYVFTVASNLLATTESNGQLFSGDTNGVPGVYWWHGTTNQSIVANGGGLEVRVHTNRLAMKIGRTAQTNYLVTKFTESVSFDGTPVINNGANPYVQFGAGAQSPSIKFEFPSGSDDGTFILTNGLTGARAKLAAKEADISDHITLGTVKIFTGAGTPEGVKSAPRGSLFLRTDGAATTTLYVKTSGTGNTGWTAK